MKQDIIKLGNRLICMAVILSIIVIFLNNVYKNGYFLNTLEIEKFEHVPKHIQVANTGNSHGMNGIIYPENDFYSGFNFALGSQPLLYDYQILKNYSECIDEDAVVFIGVSYFSLYREITNADANMTKRYYFFLRPENVVGYSRKDDILYHYLPVLAIHPDQLAKVVQNVVTYYKNKIETLTESERETDKLADYAMVQVENIEEIGRERFEEHYRTYQAQNGAMAEEAVTALEDILQLCKDRKWRAILITTPYTAQYADHFPQELIDDVTQYLYEIAEKYDTVYWDYSKNEEFRNDLTLFKDSDHLNDLGAQKFTDILIKRCVSEGYLLENNP